MPHDLGPHIPTSYPGMLALMNAYDTNAVGTATLKHTLFKMYVRKNMKRAKTKNKTNIFLYFRCVFVLFFVGPNLFGFL